jgi:DNA-binding CsgD family transcriptional regulator
MFRIYAVQTVLLTSAFFAGSLSIIYRQTRNRAVRDYLGWHCGMTLLGALVGLDAMQGPNADSADAVKALFLCALLVFQGWMSIRLSFTVAKRPRPRHLPWLVAIPALAAAAAYLFGGSTTVPRQICNGWLVLSSACALALIAFNAKALGAPVRKALKAVIAVFAACLPLFGLDIAGVAFFSGSAFLFFLVWNCAGICAANASGYASASLLTARSVPPPVSKRYGLTPREIEIANLVIAGKKTKEIADELCRSSKTVKNHLSNIYYKTGVSNRLELLALISSSMAD